MGWRGNCCLSSCCCCCCCCSWNKQRMQNCTVLCKFVVVLFSIVWRTRGKSKPAESERIGIESCRLPPASCQLPAAPASCQLQVAKAQYVLFVLWLNGKTWGSCFAASTSLSCWAFSFPLCHYFCMPYAWQTRCHRCWLLAAAVVGVILWDCCSSLFPLCLPLLLAAICLIVEIFAY